MGTDHDWEQWGAQDPYFGVLTHPKFRRDALTDDARNEFFASGHWHVQHVLAACRQHVDPAFAPTRALDFGCGVGRLLIPLAELAAEVVGVDVSPSMLEEARRNCAAAGVHNVSLIPSDDDLSQLTGDFDFVHSFIVLQHIEVERGRQLFQRLVKLVRPGGIGALHVTFGWSNLPDSLGQPPRAVLPEALRKVTPAVPTRRVKDLLNTLGLRSAETDPRPGAPGADPVMQMNCYSLSELLFILQQAGIQRTHTELTDHGGALGALLYFQKPGGTEARLPLPAAASPVAQAEVSAPAAPAPPAALRYADAFTHAIQAYEAGEGPAHAQRVELELYTKLQWRRGVFEACRAHADLNGRRFLEVGCGTGYTSVAAAEAGMLAEATDYADKTCELARWRFREHGLDIPVFQSDPREPPPAERLGRYGFVFCAQVLERIPRASQFQALRHLFDQVAPGGLVYINTENALHPHDRHDTKLPLVRLLAQQHAARLAQLMGKSLNLFEPLHGQTIAIHDYLSYDEIAGAAAVMGFEVLNPFMPYDSARTLFSVLTGSDWFYENVGQFFDAEKFLPVSLLLRRKAN